MRYRITIDVDYDEASFSQKTDPKKVLHDRITHYCSNDDLIDSDKELTSSAVVDNFRVDVEKVS